MKLLQGHGPRKGAFVLSLCDYTGNWAAPWHEEGYTVMLVDLKHGDDLTTSGSFDILRSLRPEVVLAAPPCTDFTISGAQYWPAKDADGRTAASLRVVQACLQLVTHYYPRVWCMENPVGRLPKLLPDLGKPKAYVHPHEYALYGKDFSELHVNRYTKKTGLWGRFTLPEKAPAPPIRVSSQGSWLMKLGGKSERTKELRSATPMAFARAFHLANRG